MITVHYADIPRGCLCLCNPKSSTVLTLVLQGKKKERKKEKEVGREGRRRGKDNDLKTSTSS